MTDKDVTRETLVERVKDLEAKCALLEAALGQKLDKADFEMIGTVYEYPLVLWNNNQLGGVASFKGAVDCAEVLFREISMSRQLR